MTEFNFVECRKCGTIHYIISKEKAKTLKKLDDSFLTRDLTHCSKCGSKDNFSIISEMHVGYYGISDKISPVLIDCEKFNTLFSKGSIVKCKNKDRL